MIQIDRKLSTLVNFELTVYKNNAFPDDIACIPSPRLFATHLPYQALAQSIKQSSCRIVYIVRNPLDVIVPHFVEGCSDYESWSLEKCFDMFCNGEDYFGPFWDHVLGYWKENLGNPKKVLFLKYVELKEDATFQIKRLAEFMGFPFSEEEESGGVIEKIAKFCSFKNMKEMEVNKKGKLPWCKFENKLFFREGKAGDFVNHLNAEQVKRFNQILEDKLGKSRLTWKLS